MVRLICVSGHPGAGDLLDEAAEAVRYHGQQVVAERFEGGPAQLVERVRAVLAAGEFPFVLGGPPLTDLGEQVLLISTRAAAEFPPESGIQVLDPAFQARDPAGFLDEVWALSDRATGVHLHIELDGPSSVALREAVVVATSCGQVRSASLSSEQPLRGRAGAIALDLVGTVVAVLP